MSETLKPISGRALAGVLLAFGGLGATLLAIGPKNYPNLHTVLDTAVFLFASVLAYACWNMGQRANDVFLQWMARVFTVLACLNFVHVVVAIEWPGFMAAIDATRSVFRPATWPPAAVIFPLGIGAGLVLLHRQAKVRAAYTAALVVSSLLLLLSFYFLPRYTAPTLFGITRPALAIVPALWLLGGWMCWRHRGEHRMLHAMAFMCGIAFVGSAAMLYSRAPHDMPAMIAHVGKCSAYLLLLLRLLQIAAWDMQERALAESELGRLNSELEARVSERTAELERINRALQAEIAVRQTAEQRTHAQLERLDLLQQITRAIGERQDLQSIFQAVLRHVEDSLPIDFGCICLYDPLAYELQVIRVGVKSEPVALDLMMAEQAKVPVDANGLSLCVQGQLVYEPDIAQVPHPFPQRLASGGLRSLVAAPLLVESSVFGVLIAARLQAHAFSSADCEFLRQLSEHTALAAHQSQLYTALQRAYEDLHQTQQAILQQERLRALGQMASGIAHDINNAISPISLYTDLLLEEKHELSEAITEYLEVIRHAVKDVTHTVSRMREFYRQREPALALSPVDANQVVRQVVDLTRARWSDIPQQRGIVVDMVTELAPDLPAMLGVESEVREALINLVFNAVDAMPGGGAVTLRTSIARAERHEMAQVRIEVQDTGVGMDEDTARRCMEPFFTTKGERGTGLGLAMVYGIVQRHGADIDIISAPGEGTTMCLSFPHANASAPALAAELEPARPPRLRVLVIDDDPLLTKSLRDTLEKDGHIVTTASGGQAGIDAFRLAYRGANAFAVVITDLGMPYVDGRQVAQSVKTMCHAMPVILLTGWGQRLAAEGDIPPHVDRVLSKPPKLRELRKALVELVGEAAPVSAK